MTEVVESPIACPRCGAPAVLAAAYCTWCGLALPRPLASAGVSAPPGWYADPYRHFRLRYWDGRAWTEHVFTSWPARDPLPEPGAVRHFRRGGDPVLVTLLGLVLSYGLGALAEYVTIWLGMPGAPYSRLVVFSVVFWAGLATTCRLASRRYGSGRLRTDLQIRVRIDDLAIGIVGALTTLFLGGLMTLLIEHLHRFHLSVPSYPLVPSRTIPTGGWIVLALFTAVGAPIFEELYFRGLLQTVVLERAGRVAAVGLTAAVFATGHVFNAPGLAGVAYALEVLPAGIAFCCIRLWTGRLGSSMVTHCLYNSSVLAVLAWHLGYFSH
jgi:membrane protease YdiL (CAAX protease family)